jgi:hypothetical protein
MVVRERPLLDKALQLDGGYDPNQSHILTRYDLEPGER